MSPTNPGPTRRPVALVAAVGTALVIGIAVLVISVSRASTPGEGLAAASPSPTASSSPTPSSRPAPANPLPCAAAQFGAALAPLNPPSDIHKYTAAPPTSIDAGKLYEATITTPKGAIVLCLDPKLAPNTVNAFVTLARNHFYDGLIFHRVIADFVAQGGDPEGTGRGGPGYKFNDESVKQQYAIGAVAMANGGANDNGSQFFICTGTQCSGDGSASNQGLEPKYNLFGNVLSGQDVAAKIAQGDKMTTVTVAEQK